MSEWISVDDERKPEEYSAVIGLFEYKSQCIVAYFNGKFFQDTSQANLYGHDSGMESIEEQPTHWMPLPEPPSD